MPAVSKPRLIRPVKDGQQGEWSYLFHANGEDFIFPALVNEIGHLQTPYGIRSGKEDDTRDYKVVYWKASQWETKLLPQAVDWFRRNQFTLPKVPYVGLEVRKIEDRDGSEGTLAEIVRFGALEKRNEDFPCVLLDRWKAVPGEQDTVGKPIMQWCMESNLYFKGAELSSSGFSVLNACQKMADWGHFPEFLKTRIEEKGSQYFFEAMSVNNTEEATDEELRLATMFVAFCRYITSLKTTYIEGLPAHSRRRSEARTTEEALALEQATIFKTVGVLKGGEKKKPVATGTGTKHRHRYMVRGHERIINGKVIWVKPQIRGEGEFLSRSVATEEALVDAKGLEPPVKIEVNAKSASPVRMEGSQPPEASDPPTPRPSRLKTAVLALVHFFRSFLR